MNNKEEINYDEFVEHLKNPKTSMTPEELVELKKKVYKSLSIDRQKLFMRQPFIGGMLMRMELVPVRDYRCNTACTDYRKIYFDIDFYKSLTEEQRRFILAHEIWHVVYMHFLRTQNRIQELWNIAVDCEINYMLKSEGFQPPEDLCFPPPGLEGQNAETIYEYYVKEAKKQKKNGGNQKGNGSGENNSNNRLKGQFDKHISKEQSDGSNNPQNGKKNPYNGNNDSSDNDNGFSLPKDQWGEKGEDVDYTPQINKDASERIREMIISEAQRYERTQGKLPASLEGIVSQLRKPEISWKEYLSQFVTRCMGDKRVWLPPNRHHVWNGGYFQSRRGERIKVVVTVDTSGSTEPDLPKFMTELISLLNTFGRYELTLIQCDSEIQDVSEYSENIEFPVNTPSVFKWKGFGGSCLNPAFNWIDSHNIEANIHIVFTDGYIEVPKKDPLGIPTLFVITTDGDKNLCNWGEKIIFKEERDEQF